MATVVLQGAGDGDDVIQPDLIHIFALHTVAGNIVPGLAGLDDDGDVVVLCAVLRFDADDTAGQGDLIGQALASLQRKGSFQDLLRISGNFKRVFTLFDANQQATCVKFNGALVVLDVAGDGDDIAGQQVLAAVALQAVAHNGLVFTAGDLDGNGDVLVVSAVGGINSNDLTLQGNFVRQRLAVFQCVSSVDDLKAAAAHGNGQHMLPGQGSGSAVGTGNGSGQSVGNLNLAVFVDIDGDHAVGTLHDLDSGFVAVNGVNDFVSVQADTNGTQTLKVRGSLVAVTDGLVICLQVSDGIFQIVICHNSLLSGGSGSRSVGGISSGSGRGSTVATAGQQRQHHNCQQNPRNDSLHSKLLYVMILFDNGDVFRGEYFDLIVAAEVIHNASDIDGTAEIGILLDQVAIFIVQHHGTNGDRDTVHSAV